MKERIHGGMDVDEYIAKQKPELRRIVKALRDLVKQAAPNLSEQLKWEVPWYVGKGNVCYIAAMTSWVNLGFSRGTELKDPKLLLEGSGKGMRHIKVRKVEDIDSVAITALIKQAATLKPKK